jgi:hypothetical protein
VIVLTRRFRMPYLRTAALDVVPAARAQRGDLAELVREYPRRRSSVSPFRR